MFYVTGSVQKKNLGGFESTLLNEDWVENINAGHFNLRLLQSGGFCV